MGNPATNTNRLIIWGVRESDLNRISQETARVLLTNAAHLTAMHLDHDLSYHLGALATAICHGNVGQIKASLEVFDEVMGWAVTPD